jgi:predicted Zn-dependent peptidase
MMKTVRKELSPGVFFNYIHATKFKTGLLSAQLVVPLDAARASAGALLPAVLRRGTARHGDILALSRALDLLYGAGLSFTVRKKGENQCLGFLASFIDDRFALGGEKLLEPTAALLGEVLLRPATEGGVFRRDYVDGEKDNLIDAIRAVLDDKRDYADKRLLEEMCRLERYGVSRLGTEEAVAALDGAGLWDFYQQTLMTARVELFYCGSAEEARVEDALRRGVAALPHGARVSPAASVRVAAPETPRSITETMDVTQGKLSMGWRAATDDRHAMMVANLIFGGYSNSRLFLNVREKLSLCYYASSGYHRSKGIVTVSSGVEFADEARAKSEIFAQLASIQSGELEPWELEGAKGVLRSAVRSREDSGTRMEENLLGQAATGLWESEEELLDALDAMTPERVAAAARSMTLDTVYFLKGEGEANE